MILSLLGGGTPDPPISRPQPSAVGRSGDFRRLAPGAPWAPTWSAWRGPLERVPLRQGSSGASYLLCSSSSTRSPGPPVGQSVGPSQRESARRLTPWPPRGARTPWRPPRPPARAGLRAARRASGGAGREPPGRGRAGRGRERGGGASAPRVGRRPGQRAASRPLRVPAPYRARSALGAAPLPPPRLRPLLDVSSRSEEGFFFFFSFPFLLCQGSQKTRGEASPRTFKGAVVTRGAARGSRD